MNTKLRTSLVAAILTIAALGGGTVPASAAQTWTTVSAGGGTFQYRATSIWNECGYNHPTRKHRCTVENLGGTQRSLDRPAGVLALKSQKASIGGNKAYWYAY